jgi:hypothetical protein
MRAQTLEIRIERLEQATKERSNFPLDCICFPEKEQPFVGFPIELKVASKLKCPLHGERFKPQQSFVYVSRWLREKLWKHLWSQHSEQYRKAWFASFPPELWPAEEVLADGKLVLRLKDGTMLPLSGTTGES